MDSKIEILDLFRDFTPQQIELLKPKIGGACASREKMSLSAKARWAKMSLEEKKDLLERSFHSKESKKKSQEATRKIWAEKTPEEIKRHVETSFLSEEAKRKSKDGYRRFIANLDGKDRKLFFEHKREGILDFWESERGGRARLVVSRKAREAWVRKTPEEKEAWLRSSCHSEIARVKIGPRRTLGLRAFWRSLTPEEVKERLDNSVWSREARLRLVKTLHSGPSEPERFLGRFLDRYFPNEWIFNGNGKGSIMVGLRIPDFIRSDGIKWIISEMGGLGIFHFLGDEKEEVEYYRRFGYLCTVLWEWDCYDWSGLKKKLDDVMRTELPGLEIHRSPAIAEGGD